MSGAFGFWEAFGNWPAALAGDKVGVGGGDSSKNVWSDSDLGRGEYFQGWRWVLFATYRLHVFFQTWHSACLLLLLFVQQDLSADHDVLCPDGFGQPHL